jgi:hypothetical protein
VFEQDFAFNGSRQQQQMANAAQARSRQDLDGEEREEEMEQEQQMSAAATNSTTVDTSILKNCQCGGKDGQGRPTAGVNALQ